MGQHAPPLPPATQNQTFALCTSCMCCTRVLSRKWGGACPPGAAVGGAGAAGFSGGAAADSGAGAAGAGGSARASEFGPAPAAAVPPASAAIVGRVFFGVAMLVFVSVHWCSLGVFNQQVRGLFSSELGRSKREEGARAARGESGGRRAPNCPSWRRDG